MIANTPVRMIPTNPANTARLLGRLSSKKLLFAARVRIVKNAIQRREITTALKVSFVLLAILLLNLVSL